MAESEREDNVTTLKDMNARHPRADKGPDRPDDERDDDVTTLKEMNVKQSTKDDERQSDAAADQNRPDRRS